MAILEKEKRSKCLLYERDRRIEETAIQSGSHSRSNIQIRWNYEIIWIYAKMMKPRFTCMGKGHWSVAERGDAPGIKQHTHIGPWLHHPSFPVSEVHGLLSLWKRRNKRSRMVCGPPWIMFFYIFSWWGWGDKNRILGSYGTKAKIWQRNYPKVLLKLKSCHFNCFKGNFQAWKFQICLGLWSIHGSTLAGIIILRPRRGHHSVPVCCSPVNVFIQPCDTGSPVSHAWWGCLQFAPILRVFRLTSGSILGFLRLDLTGCGEFDFFVLTIFAIQSLLLLFPDRCSGEAWLQ